MRTRFALLPIVLALVLIGPATAFAAGPDRPFSASAVKPLELSCTDIVEVPVACSPASIECGIPCGMTEMCGQDPCLCGATDEFGACACNGRKTVCPTFTLDDDGGCVALVDFAGKQWLVPKSEGSADVVVRASLPHHVDAVTTVHVDVKPFGVLDGVKVAIALVVIAAVIAGIVFGARALVRIIGKARTGEGKRNRKEMNDGTEEV